MSQILPSEPFSAYYKNHRGEVAWRTLEPLSIWFGTTPYHKQPQWFIQAIDKDKEQERDFALLDFQGDEWTEKVVIGDHKLALEHEKRELDMRAANLGYELVSTEDADLLKLGLTVGGGLSVYGTVEAVGRVQTIIMLLDGRPVEREGVQRTLMRDLKHAELREQDLIAKVKELTAKMVGA